MIQTNLFPWKRALHWLYAIIVSPLDLNGDIDCHCLSIDEPVQGFVHIDT